MPRIVSSPCHVDVPDGWEDITESVWTLARPDGVGALQFSVALYSDGEPPNPSLEQLLEMVEDFAKTRGLGAPQAVRVVSEPLLSAAASFRWGDDFVRVWYVSDRLNFALVTYVCEAGQEWKELSDCEEIVKTLEFGTV